MSRFTKLMGLMLLVFTFTTVTGVRAYHANRVRIEAQNAKRLKQERQLPKNKSKSSLAGDEQSTAVPKKKALQKKQSKKATAQTKKVDWKAPSENKPYPDVNKYSDLSIKVSTSKQKVFFMAGSKKLYTMRASTGSPENPTPTGHFKIQAERGAFFYSSQTKEGAKYYVSFKDHGIYLFHTVPTDQNGNFIKSEAEELGEKANSHGCVRLSVADAKWLYENIKEGTNVEID